MHPVRPNSTRHLTEKVEQACLVAKDAAFNLRDFVEHSSKMAAIAVKECEKELDQVERMVDEEMSSAISEVSESSARELLACMKFIIDLERIGDLLWSVVKGLQKRTARLSPHDKHDLATMAGTLEEMLVRIHTGFVEHDVEPANWVLRKDAQLDNTCRTIFHRHLDRTDPKGREDSVILLFAGQALERAGDHAKNLAEEIVHLVEGRSLRHEAKRRRRVD